MKPKIFMDAFIRVRDGRGNPFASLRIDRPFTGTYSDRSEQKIATDSPTRGFGRGTPHKN